jgi:hypothetical protein
MKKERIFKRPFWIEVPDPTANNGIARLKFLPDFDRVPSTRELVNTKELAQKYISEISK